MPKKVINNEKFAYLRVGLVKKRGSYLDVHYVPYITLIGKSLLLLTFGIFTASSRTFFVLLLLKHHYYVQCTYHSLARNTEYILLYFCRCHYFVEQWTISLRCVIIVRSWVSKDFVVSGILITYKLTDLNFLCLSYK